MAAQGRVDLRRLLQRRQFLPGAAAAAVSLAGLIETFWLIKTLINYDQLFGLLKFLVMRNFE